MDRLKRRSVVSSAAWSLVAIAGAATASAQQVLWELDDDFDFGHAVNAAVDLDQDGKADVAIGKPQANPCHNGTGFVLLASGLDGTTLGTWPGPIWFAQGWDLEAAGDINGDGLPDLIQASPDNFPDCPYLNRMEVRSTANGSAIFSKIYSTGSFDDLAACGIGDINGDGRADVAYGDANSGFVEVYSGSTGTLVISYSASSLGSDISDLGDVNLDGSIDFAVGAKTEAGTGTVRIYSGAGPLLATIPGLTAGEWFGAVVDGLGDIDLDGKPDLIVGAPHAAPIGAASGAARIVSGSTLAVTSSVNGIAAGDQFGWSVTRQVDFDGDGRTDYAVGSLGGYARMFSGATGAVVATFPRDGMSGDYGAAVDGSGDVDGNGRGDLVIGSPNDQGQPSGVRVVTYCPGNIVSYGAACAGAGGIKPSLTLGGCPTPGGTVSFALDDALGHSTAILFLGGLQGSLPLPNGCTLLVSSLLPFTVTLPLGGAGPGQGSIAFNASIPPSSPAGSVALQAFVIDPLAQGGYSATNGVKLTIQ